MFQHFPLMFINEDIALAVKQTPTFGYYELAYNSFLCRIGMVVAHGSLAGLREFGRRVFMK